MMKYWRVITLGVVTLLTAGCPAPTPARSARLSVVAPPANWSGPSARPAETPAAWLDSLADPRLDKLVQEGLRNNFDLHSAAARVKTAEARARLAGADLSPHASLEASGGRRRTSNNGSATTGNNFSLQATLGWEVDLWNRLGSAEQAALSELGASEADRYAAELSLVAGIARAWYRLSEADLQLQLARSTETSYQQGLQVIDEQYRSGLDSAFDLRLARATLANAQSVRFERQRLLDQQRRQLEALLGRYPDGLLETVDRLPQLTMEVPAGLPSSLLERRPDLQAAALRLTAADQRVVAASRNRLPVFKLTAAAGTASEQLYRLLDLDYLIWNLAGSLVQPLFDGGRRSAEQDLAQSQAQQLLADYAAVVLNAYREVEEALAAESFLQQQEGALRISVLESAEALTLAEQRYQQGLEGIITLLDTQRRAYAARIALLASSRQRLENRINLHLALGGSFTAPAAPSTVKESP